MNYQPQLVTLPETNIFAPENGCLGDDRSFPFGALNGLFSGVSKLAVSFSEGRRISGCHQRCSNFRVFRRWFSSVFGCLTGLQVGAGAVLMKQAEDDKVSYENKKRGSLTFHGNTGCLIGILISLFYYYNLQLLWRLHMWARWIKASESDTVTV